MTVVNVALPEIQADLDASFSELQWVIDAYALVLGVILLTAGALADRVGRRRVFVLGLAVFTVASLLCALARSPLLLDVARGLQGLGGAAMFATSLALLAEEFAPRERGFALGVWGAISGGALAVGPLVGGALVDGPGWRWVFLLNLPLGVALIAASARLRESRDPRPRRADWAGVATFTIAAFALVFALIRVNAEGWGSPPIVGALAGGAAMLAVFVRVELRAQDPMLDLRLFGIPAFSGTAIVAFAQSFALYPMFLFLALFFQQVLEYTPWETGLRLLPVTAVLFAVAPLSGRLTGRVPLRFPLAAGLALIGTGLLLMRAVQPGSAWTALLPGFLVGGLGIGVISPALTAAMVGVLPVERAGLASGINNTFRQLGIAVGIAALGAVFQHRIASTVTAALSPSPGGEAGELGQLVAQGRLEEALAAGGGTGAELATAAELGFIRGLDDIFLVAAAVALVAVPAALALVRPPPEAPSPLTDCG